MPPQVYRGAFLFNEHYRRYTLQETIMSIVKGFVTGIASSCFLLGGLLSSESNRTVAHLFTHYLGGSGEAVTLRLPQVLNTYCSGTTGVVSTYGTPYEWALGDFTCTPQGKGYDVYDFKYAGEEGRTCRRLSLRRYRFYLLRGGGYALHKIKEVPADIGRCIVGKGYGKPFEVHITR
jgi:hypothetical protein